MVRASLDPGLLFFVRKFDRGGSDTGKQGTGPGAA
jgi:hypothetical protein